MPSNESVANAGSAFVGALAVPARVGLADVERVEAVTRALRVRDYRDGGGSCQSVVLAHLASAHRLFGAEATDVVVSRLRVAVADLHNLAGWTSFDIGHHADAHTHFSHGLTLAKQAGDDDLAANIYYRIGRVHLHFGSPYEALGLFELGQHAARRSGSPLATAILHANQAWAHAAMGATDQALACLALAGDTFATADPATAPTWAVFFDQTDLSAMIGVVRTTLAQLVHTRHTHTAIPALTTAITAYGDAMTRSRTFSQILLAVNHMIEDDIDHAVAAGLHAVDNAENLRSARVRHRLRALRNESDRHRGNPAARELSHQIGALTAQHNGP